MVRFLNAPQSSRMSDVLREHLAQSAASRLVSDLAPKAPQQYIPEPSLFNTMLPVAGQALGTAATMGAQAIEQRQMAQEQQRMNENLAKYIAKEYGRPLEEATQIANMRPEERKQALAMLQEQRKESGKFELEEKKFENRKYLAQLEHERKLERERYKKDLNKEFAPEDPKKASYERALTHANRIDKLIKSGKIKKASGGFLAPRKNEELVRYEVTNLMSSLGDAVGLGKDQQKQLVDNVVDQLYSGNKAQQDIMNVIMNDINPGNMSELSTQIAQLNAQQPDQMQSAQPMQNQMAPESAETQYPEDESFFGKVPGLLARGLAATAELPAMIHPYKAPAGKSMLPAQMTADAIREITPEAEGIDEKIVEEIGMDLPFIGLALATTGPLGAALATGKTALGALSANLLEEYGYGPVPQFAARLGSSLAIDKAINGIRTGSTATQLTRDLTEDYTQLYKEASEEGKNIRLDPQPVRESLDHILKHLEGPQRGIKDSDVTKIKNVIEDYYGRVNAPFWTLEDIVGKQAIEGERGVRGYQSALNKQVQNLESKDARSLLNELNRGINKMLEPVANEVAVQKYNAAKDMYASIESLDFIEKKLEKWAGSGRSPLETAIKGGVVSGIWHFLGIKPAAAAVGGYYGLKGISGAARAGRLLYKYPKAQALMMQYIHNNLVGDANKATRNLNNLAKIARGLAKNKD